MIKSKPKTLLSLKNSISKDLDTIIISAGILTFNNIDQNSNALSGQSNVPSNFTTRTTNHSSIPTVPATPMATTPSTYTVDFHPAANHPAGGQPISNHTSASHTDKWVINLSKTPLTQEQLSLLQKGPNYAITPKYPP